MKAIYVNSIINLHVRNVRKHEHIRVPSFYGDKGFYDKNAHLMEKIAEDNLNGE